MTLTRQSSWYIAKVAGQSRWPFTQGTGRGRYYCTSDDHIASPRCPTPPPPHVIFMKWRRLVASVLDSHVGLDKANNVRASDFPFQTKQFSVSKKVKFRFDSVSLLATLNSIKSQYIERKCGERTVKMAQLDR